MFKKVVQNTTILSSGTLLSRLLGFIRDILIARYFGGSAALEAFIVSFRLPNIFRSIFAEGFSDSVATPVLSEYQDNKQRIFAIANHLLSLFMVTLCVVSLLGSISAKYLVILIAPGFVEQAVKFNLAVSFTRVTFIYLFLIGLSSVVTSVLYSLKKFFVPALNPVFLNISFIVGILFFSRFLEHYILIVCVVAAGILQLIFPFIFLRREGFILRFNFLSALRDKAVIRMLKLFVPRIWASIVYHLRVFVDTIFSSFSQIVGQNALSSIYFANRMIQFPFALIALSISKVAIVDFSSYHRQGNMGDFKKLFVFSFQNIIFFIVPLSVIFLFISEPIIDVIFVRGKFDVNLLKMTSSVFFFYSFGLFFFCGIKLLVNSFYALKDTSTPTKIATVALVVNVALSAILMFPLRVGGVALGSSLAAALNFFLLHHFLMKKVGRIDWQDTKVQSLKVLLLSIVIGIVCRLLWNTLAYCKYVKMLIVVINSLVIFIAGGYILGLEQIVYLQKWILKRK